MLSTIEQIRNCLQVSAAAIPINIFQCVQSKTPLRTHCGTVEQIAAVMRSKPTFVDQKEKAKLVTFNTYTQGATSRGTASIELAHAICGDWDKNFDLSVFDRGMAELDEAGAKVIAYQTYSHTPEAPRWRIFVFIDESVTPADYRTCWEGLNDVFGGNLDPNAKDCARLNYWPSCPVGHTRKFRTLNIEVA
jgi:hypothetical protein